MDDNYGVSRSDTRERDGIWSVVHLGEVLDEDATISTAGYNYDDEEAGVEVVIKNEGAELTLNMSAQRARQFAADLDSAADHAEYGPQG